MQKMIDGVTKIIAIEETPQGKPGHDPDGCTVQASVSIARIKVPVTTTPHQWTPKPMRALEHRVGDAKQRKHHV